MTYKTKCTDNCLERIEEQSIAIIRLRASSAEKTSALIKASKQITQLKAEKAELTDLLNKQSAELKTAKDINHQQKLKLHRVHENYTRRDCNWDGGWRA